MAFAAPCGDCRDSGDAPKSGISMTSDVPVDHLVQDTLFFMSPSFTGLTRLELLEIELHRMQFSHSGLLRF